MSMPAGWYPDPFSSAGFLRWWDGVRWTPQTRLAEPATEPDQPLAPPPPAPTAYPGQPGQPGQGGYAGYGAPAPSFPVASWGLRVVAYLIDSIVVGVVVAPVYLVSLWPAFRDLFAAIPTDGSAVPTEAVTRFQEQVLGSSLLLTVVYLVVTLLYVVPQHVRYGRTLGKRVVGVRVRMLAEDRNPGWREALLRWLVLFGGSAIGGVLFLALDGLWPLWDRPWAQALHDKAVRTVVVPARTTALPPR